MPRLLKLIVVALALVAVPAWAQEMPGPGQLPSRQGDWRMGLTASHQFEWKLSDYTLEERDLRGRTVDAPKTAKIVDDTYYMTTLAYGVHEGVSLFATIGAAYGGKLKETDKTYGYTWEGKMRTVLTWGLGFSYTAQLGEEGPGFLLVGRFLRYDDRRVTDWKLNQYGENAHPPYLTDDFVDYWQMDVMATLFKRFGRFTPSLGLGITHGEYDYNGRWTVDAATGAAADGSLTYDASLRSQDLLLVQPGLNVALDDRFSLDLTAGLGARTTLGLGFTGAF